MILALLVAAALPTWTDVAPLLEQHCVQCHYDGGPAPFALQTWEQAARRAAFIDEVVQQGVMPPAGLRSAHPLANGFTRLDAAQKKVLHDWVKEHASGATPGEPPRTLDAPAPASTPAGLIRRVSMPVPWTMSAEGGENWGRRVRDKRTFVMSIGNTEALRIRGWVHHTSQPQVVHGVSFAVDNEGRARWSDEREEGPGYRMLGDVGWTPSGSLGTSGIGARTLVLPKGYHWEVPPQSDLVMETHFRPDGRVHDLREAVDLIPAQAGASRPVRTAVSMVRMVQVPVDAVQTVTDELVLEHDVDLVAVTPRAQGVCTSMSIEAIKPDGTSHVLAETSSWDPHWRRMVVFEQPIRLRAGTKLRSSWTLENTTSNPRNPFIPLATYTLAQRTGAVAWLLHVAAVEPEQDDLLQAWGVSQLRARQR